MTVLQVLALGFTLVLSFMAPDAGIIVHRTMPDGSLVLCVAAAGQLKVSCWSPTVEKNIDVAALAAKVARPE